MRIESFLIFWGGFWISIENFDKISNFGITIREIFSRFGRSPPDLGDLLQIWEIFSRFGRSSQDLGDLLHDFLRAWPQRGPESRRRLFKSKTTKNRPGLLNVWRARSALKLHQATELMKRNRLRTLAELQGA